MRAPVSAVQRREQPVVEHRGRRVDVQLLERRSGARQKPIASSDERDGAATSAEHAAAVSAAANADRISGVR